MNMTVALRSWRSREFVFWFVACCMCWNYSVGRQQSATVEPVQQPTQPRVYSPTRKAADNSVRETEGSSEFTLRQPVQQPGIVNLGCKGIRIRRYVSNGFCTSPRPIRDMICEGQCLPMDELPWFSDYSKVHHPEKRIWRCVQDEVRRKKVKVYCRDGSERKYRITIVRSCKCKRYTRQQNLSELDLRR